MLEIKNLSKIFKNKNTEKTALDDVSFKINKGEFVALLGHNGAGKSTLINILAGNIKKSSGKVVINNLNLDKQELKTKKIMGIVPQEISFDIFFNVKEVLKNQSGYFGIMNNDKYINELLEKLSLMDKKNVNTRNLSGGMRRRLLIAKALVHKPDILILDEPTAGVDIELRQSMYKFLRELHESGTTIILTTHYLEEAENLCDRILVLNNGKLIMDESKDKIMNDLGSEIRLEFSFDSILNIDKFNFLKKYSPVIIKNTKLELKAIKDDISDILNKMKLNKVDYKNFKIEQKKLEDIFLNIVKN